LHPDDVANTLKVTLTDLQLSYLDLYLIHLPVPVEYTDGNVSTRRLNGFGLQDTWRQLEACVKEGLTKSIGCSNFNIQTLNDCLNYAHIAPAVNQVERHPYLVQADLVKFCNRFNVAVTAYGALGAKGFANRSGLPLNVEDLLDNAVIKQIASKHNKTTAQVLIRWSVDSGVIVIPKSVQEKRIQENFNVSDFKLSAGELQEIAALDRSFRFFANPFDLDYSAFL